MSDPRFILALDQGTTSSRSIVFDRAGQQVSAAQQEFTQHYPRPGWVEHDANEIWTTQRQTMEDALARSGGTAKDVAAIGITNQRETLVVWDRGSGEPVAPAIVWQDRRTSDDCARWVEQGLESRVTEITGLRLDPYFTGSKLAWLLRHVNGLKTKAESGQVLAGTIDTWLIWKLTDGAVHATDASNASRTLLFNLSTGDWDQEMLELFGVPHAMLPEVRDSSGEFGRVADGLPAAGVPITGVAGDQHAALFGQACFEPGMAKNTYGTGCFLLMQTGTEMVRSQNNLLTTVAWRLNGRMEYALEGSVFVAGAAVQWMRDELKLVESAEQLSELAGSVPDANGAILVPAFAGLGAPHWDPYARGTLVGLTRGTNRAHLCRAVLDSIALQSADLIAAMEKDAGVPLQELRVDGGASRSAALMQIQADLLGSPVVRPVEVETTALGAAYLAGLGVGWWSDRGEIARAWKADTKFTRQRPIDELDRLRRDWAKAVERAKHWEESSHEK
ncbi:glycerol kinase GlpK [Synoicihabitans lomoniglobus]|uniref:Glycerol kinase n=1 Tax=Synoicihabitans lomoniglobus TaxID=2909285 RepID=A0AAF0I4N9_9BACT|nr:glycerol kinase GlpK [Opitutaceae bacterium LMO-M01]WED66943.1 glycerol kinase GlpK [Opitutaceae bacterium LMO-M01]